MCYFVLNTLLYYNLGSNPGFLLGILITTVAQTATAAVAGKCFAGMKS